MRKILTLCVVAMLGILHAASAQNDPKAKAVLDAATKKMNSLKSLKANFSLKLTSANGKVMDNKKGTFYLKGEEEKNSLRLNYTGSSESEIRKGIALLGLSIKELLKKDQHI